jgi:hypothetical protein
VGPCGGTALSAGISYCTCGTGHSVRPCINNANWGGMNTATCSSPTQDMSVEVCSSSGSGGFCSCVGTWCPQAGTLDQYTRCESAADACATCVNPEIRYGTTTGGIPASHSGNNYATWCTQLGFSGYSGTVAYGSRSCAAPLGKLFGCTGYDESGVWHWCDWMDGYWRSSTLDYHSSCTSGMITSITCTP